MSNFEYVLPVIRGLQGGREYYVSMCPLPILPKLFPLRPSEVEPASTSHRRLNSGRVKKITEYVFKNSKDYILSAITASIDADVIFEPLGEERKIGRLRIPMEGELTIQDGLHRRVALEKALKENPKLGYESIAVIFFLDIGLERSQQMFRDLNSYGVRSSLSLGVLYEHRDQMALLTKKILARVAKLRDLTEFERDSISKSSGRVFTLYQVYQETCGFLQQHREQDFEAQLVLAVQYWQEKLSCF